MEAHAQPEVGPIPLVQHLCRIYPFKNELEVPRIVKLVFLSDWLAAIVHGSPLSSCKWKRGETGPHSPELLAALKAARGKSLSYSVTHSPLGEQREQLEPMGALLEIDPHAAAIARRVCAMVAPMAWNDLMRAIFKLAAYVETADRGDIDLVAAGTALRANKAQMMAEFDRFRPSAGGS